MSVAIAWALVSVSATLVCMALRASLEIGGACARGGPYRIAIPCPHGLGAATAVSIACGIVGAFWYMWSCGSSPLGNLDWFPIAWAALLVATGASFLQFSSFLTGRHETVWVRLVFGVLLCAAGTILLARMLRGALHRRRDADHDSSTDRERAEARETAVARLDQLDRMRTSGEIDDEQLAIHRRETMARMPSSWPVATIRRVGLAVHLVASAAGIAAGVRLYDVLG